MQILKSTWKVLYKFSQRETISVGAAWKCIIRKNLVQFDSSKVKLGHLEFCVHVLLLTLEREKNKMYALKNPLIVGYNIHLICTWVEFDLESMA